MYAIRESNGHFVVALDDVLGEGSVGALQPADRDDSLVSFLAPGSARSTECRCGDLFRNGVLVEAQIPFSRSSKFLGIVLLTIWSA